MRRSASQCGAHRPSPTSHARSGTRHGGRGWSPRRQIHPVVAKCRSGRNGRTTEVARLRTTQAVVHTAHGGAERARPRSARTFQEGGASRVDVFGRRAASGPPALVQAAGVNGCQECLSRRTDSGPPRALAGGQQSHRGCPSAEEGMAVPSGVGVPAKTQQSGRRVSRGEGTAAKSAAPPTQKEQPPNRQHLPRRRNSRQIGSTSHAEGTAAKSAAPPTQKEQPPNRQHLPRRRNSRQVRSPSRAGGTATKAEAPPTQDGQPPNREHLPRRKSL